MKTLLNIVVVIVATTGTALAQTEGNSGTCQLSHGGYRVPSAFQNPITYFGPDYHHASTPLEGMLRGQAALVDSVGRYNYLTSRARMNELQTQRLAMDNKQQYAENQLRLRKMRSEVREAENQKRMAQIRQQNAGRSRSVQPADVTRISDAADWPKLLQDEKFCDFRTQVNQFLQEKARTGQVSATNCQQVEQTTGKILENLKADIQNIRPQDYVAVKNFARGLLAGLRGQSSPNDRSYAGWQTTQVKPAG